MNDPATASRGVMSIGTPGYRMPASQNSLMIWSVKNLQTRKRVSALAKQMASWLFIQLTICCAFLGSGLVGLLALAAVWVLSNFY